MIRHLPRDKPHQWAEKCCWCDEMWYYSGAVNAIASLSTALYIARQPHRSLSLKQYSINLSFRIQLSRCVAQLKMPELSHHHHDAQGGKSQSLLRARIAKCFEKFLPFFPIQSLFFSIHENRLFVSFAQRIVKTGHRTLLSFGFVSYVFPFNHNGVRHSH